MRFICKKYGIDFTFSDSKVSVIVAENSDMFTYLIFDLWNQKNGIKGEIIISEKEVIRHLDKCLEVIINPFDLDINNKKILSAVYKSLGLISKEYFYDKVAELNLKAIEIFEMIENNVEYNLTYDLEMDIKNFFKLYNLKLETEDAGNDLLNKLVSYIKLVHRICNIDIFVFANLKAFLDRYKFENLCKECNYEEVAIIDIEANYFSKYTKEEKCIIIDKDLCIVEID